MKAPPIAQVSSRKSPRSLCAIVAAVSAFHGVAALQAQDNIVEPALLFETNGNQIHVEDGVTVSAGADVEFTAWLFPTEYRPNNPGFWRSGPLSNGNTFAIFQGATGRPWIRWNGSDILRPASGYGVPLNEWTQVRYVVKSGESAEFWTRGPGEEWVLRHSSTHAVATPAFTIYHYGWQANPVEQIRGIHNNIELRQNDDVLLYWELNEGAGNIANDSSGNGHHGVITTTDWVDTTGAPFRLPSQAPFSYKFGTLRLLSILPQTQAGHEFGTAESGAAPFIDEVATILSLPPELDGKFMIRTANAEGIWLAEERDVQWSFVRALPDLNPDGDPIAGANTTLADGSGLLHPGPNVTFSDDWLWRVFGSSFLIYSLGPGGNPPANTPELVTTLNGFEPFETVSIQAVFWSNDNVATSWGLRAGFEYGNENHENPWLDRNSPEVVRASTLDWASPPAHFTQPTVTLDAAFLGNTTADENGVIQVFVDDFPSGNSNFRTTYHGLAVADGIRSGGGPYLAFEVDRDTTIYIINDPSSEPEWLTRHYTKTSMTVSTTAGDFDVWERPVTAREQVSLPGNSGALGDNNYWVIVGEDAGTVTELPIERLAQLLRNDWSHTGHSWRLQTSPSADLHTATLATRVANFDPESGFRLNAQVRVPFLQDGGENSYGLLLLGDGADFIRAEWLPRQPDGTSVIRFVDTSTGAVLAQETWNGLAPGPVNNDVGLAGGGEDLLQAGSPYFADEAFFFEDFEDVAAVNATWTSGGMNNVWEVGEPASPTGPSGAHSGSNVFGTDLDGQFQTWTEAWLRSPAIDLTGADNATLRFQEYLDLDTDIFWHKATVSILDANTLDELESFPPYNGQSGGWRLQEFPLSAASLGREIVIRFLVETDDFTMVDGWYIDDVEIASGSPEVSFEIVEIPATLAPDGVMAGIRTGAGDLGNTSDTYLQFTVEDRLMGDGNDGVAVYVAWDVRASGLEPDWLRNDFTRTDHFVRVNSAAGRHRLWTQVFAHEEQVTLGGASAAGAGPFPFGTHNYFVLLGEPRAGLDSFYTLEAEGIRNSGTWNLSFTLAAANAFSATVQTDVEESLDGRDEFGIAVRHPDADPSPVWETFTLSMDFLEAPEFLTFDDWRQEFFTGPGQLDDPEVSGPHANPAGDGVANLLKYALGVSPWVLMTSADLPGMDIDEQGRLILVYWERKDIDDIEYIPEISEGLVEWQTDGVVEFFREAVEAHIEEVGVRGELPGNPSRGFIRLRVERKN